jgi:hypothetical protein
LLICARLNLILSARKARSAARHDDANPETASLAEMYFRIAPGRRRAILHLIRSMSEIPPG